MRTGRACTPNPVTIGIDDTVVAAAVAMRAHDVGEVVVLDGDVPVGLVTDRDIALRAVAGHAAELGSLTLRTLLGDTEPVVATADDPLWKTVKRMRDSGVRRVVVIDDGRLAGVLTVDDALGLLAEQLGDVVALFDRRG
ncbi:MAG: CBS domain-containing protein [Myxococcota bacterium]